MINVIFRFTIADEEAANRPQDTSTRTQLTDGSTRVVDADGKVHYEGKRIYTPAEAAAVVKPIDNTFKIRYR